MQAVGQSRIKEIKVIDYVTGKDVARAVCMIIYNHESYIGSADQNKKGTYEFDVANEIKGNYQVLIWKENYIKIVKDIPLFDGKRSVYKIQPDTEMVNTVKNKLYTSENPGCDLTGFGNYEPRYAGSMNDLPQKIKAKLEDHLIKRVGVDFYSKLKLNGGQIVDLERLYIVDENAKNYKWTPYSYYLCFAFSDPKKGVGRYSSQIVLDKEGNIMKEIGLPNIAADSTKRNIIHVNDAKNIAVKKGFDLKTSKIWLGYSQKKDSFVWCFEKVVNNDGFTFNTSTLMISALDGSLVETYGGSGIY